MNSQPPRLAVALLNRVVPEEEPLTGDLVEEFAAGRATFRGLLEMDPGAGGPQQDISTTPGLSLVLGGF